MAATLTQTSITVRKIIRFGTYGLIFLIVGRIALNIGTTVYRVWFPDPPKPPTVGFGVLPGMQLPSQTVAANLNLKIETADGKLPTLPRLVKVFFMPKPAPSLLSLDVSRSKASALGFSSLGQQISEVVYTFQNPKSPSQLTMNIVTGNFSISYDTSAKPEVLSARPPTSDEAVTAARTFLSRAGILPEDISGPSSHQYLKVEDGVLKPVVSLSQASFVKVNLYRKSYDGYSSLSANLSESNIWLIISGVRAREDQILSAEYHYQAVSEEQFETYPTKSVEQAYQDLLNGKGGIARLKGVGESSDVTIRRIYMAYFDPSEEADFYQPIVVFEGDVGDEFGGFVAYVPAVSDEYYAE